MRVVVAIVTYNRASYLLKLLDGLSKQTYAIESILIVDNASTDETFDSLYNKGYVLERKENNVSKNRAHNIEYQYYYSPTNTGGAGGFNLALQIIRNQPYDFVWIMDDDVLPEENCLEVLISKISRESSVVIPNRGDSSYDDYAIRKYDLNNPFLFHVNQCKRQRLNSKDMEEDCVFVEDMTFEGPLINKGVIDLIGTPRNDFFILFDDTEYAQRILEITRITFAKDAILHRQIIQPPNRGFSWKSFYSIRNAAFFDYTYGKNIFVKHLRPRLRLVDLVLRAILRGKMIRIKWIIRAHKDGLKGKLGKTVDPDEIGLC